MLSLANRSSIPKGFGALVRHYSNRAKSPSAAGSSAPQKSDGNVPGLSNHCVKVPNTPVGPGAAKDKDYKNPEYFCYHENSFAEAEVEMAKFRLPAPSNKKKFVQ